jgi:hypothetical protein
MAVLVKVYLLLLGRVVAPFTSELELRAGEEVAGGGGGDRFEPIGAHQSHGCSYLRGCLQI